MRKPITAGIALFLLAGCKGQEVSFHPPDNARSKPMTNPVGAKNQPAGQAPVAPPVTTSGEKAAPAAPADARERALATDGKATVPPSAVQSSRPIKDIHGRPVRLGLRREKLLTGVVFEMETFAVPAVPTSRDGTPRDVQIRLAGGAGARGWELVDVQQDAQGARYFTFRRLLGNAGNPGAVR